MSEELYERITITIPIEIHKKIKLISDKEKTSKSTIVKKALEFFLKNNDQTELFNVILQRLDAIKRTSEDSDINSARVSIFMNHYVEHDVSGEDYKAIRQKVLAELNGYVTKKGYVK